MRRVGETATEEVAGIPSVLRTTAAARQQPHDSSRTTAAAQQQPHNSNRTTASTQSSQRSAETRRSTYKRHGSTRRDFCGNCKPVDVGRQYAILCVSAPLRFKLFPPPRDPEMQSEQSGSIRNLRSIRNNSSSLWLARAAFQFTRRPLQDSLRVAHHASMHDVQRVRNE